jgi:hypothetical protein
VITTLGQLTLLEGALGVRRPGHMVGVIGRAAGLGTMLYIGVIERCISNGRMAHPTRW